MLDRKSHSFRTGFLSSPLAVTRWRPWSGFHATSDTRPPEGSLSSHHVFFCRRSHMNVDPFWEAEARIWATCVFQATLVMSEVCFELLGGGAGIKTLG